MVPMALEAAIALEVTTALEAATAPKVLCNVLAPWETKSKKFLFMDDRSIVAQSAAVLQEDLAYTNAFDSETGAIENDEKRQTWFRGDGTEIEHIGILAVPDDPSRDITPAAGWEKLRACL